MVAKDAGSNNVAKAAIMCGWMGVLAVRRLMLGMNLLKLSRKVLYACSDEGDSVMGLECPLSLHQVHAACTYTEAEPAL